MYALLGADVADEIRALRAALLVADDLLAADAQVGARLGDGHIVRLLHHQLLLLLAAAADAASAAGQRHEDARVELPAAEGEPVGHHEHLDIVEGDGAEVGLEVVPGALLPGGRGGQLGRVLLGGRVGGLQLLVLLPAVAGPRPADEPRGQRGHPGRRLLLERRAQGQRLPGLLVRVEAEAEAEGRRLRRAGGLGAGHGGPRAHDGSAGEGRIAGGGYGRAGEGPPARGAAGRS